MKTSTAFNDTEEEISFPKKGENRLYPTMFFYDEPLITCDRILDLFSNQTSGIKESEMIRLLDLDPRSSEAGSVAPALDKLVKDGYLKLTGNENNVYKLRGEGLLFKRLGNYEKFVDRENRKQEIREAIQQSGIKTDVNVIKTGKSVQRLASILKPIAVVQVVVAALTFLLIAAAVILAWLTYRQQATNESLERRIRMLELDQPKSTVQANSAGVQIIHDTVYVNRISPKRSVGSRRR